MRDSSMPLHLVGETIDARQAHLRAQAGEIVQLIRGVYVDSTDDIEHTLFAHAVRIARYLYPRTYLSSASSVLLGPTPGGGRRRLL